MEKYAKDLLIEANTLKTMILQGVLPSAYDYRKDLAESLNAMKSIGVDISKVPEKATLDILSNHLVTLQSSTNKLAAAIDKLNDTEGVAQADVANKELTVLLEEVRAIADTVETHVGDKFWTYPKYTELLF